MRDPEDREAFGLTIQGLAANFRVEETEALLHVMWMGLEDMPIDRFLAAAKRALKECEFMPSVAELRRLATPTQKLIGGKPYRFMMGVGWIEDHCPPARLALASPSRPRERNGGAPMHAGAIVGEVVSRLKEVSQEPDRRLPREKDDDAPPF